MKNIIFLLTFFLFGLNLKSNAQIFFPPLIPESHQELNEKNKGFMFGVTYLSKEYNYSFIVDKVGTGHFVSQLGYQRDYVISDRSETKFYFSNLFLFSGMERSFFPLLGRVF